MIDKQFANGIDLFNQKKFRDAHRILEELWRRTDKNDPCRKLYQGLIQLTSAFSHLGKSRRQTAKGLLESSLEYVSDLPPQMSGLNISRLKENIKACRISIEDGQRDADQSSPVSFYPVLDFRPDPD